MNAHLIRNGIFFSSGASRTAAAQATGLVSLAGRYKKVPFDFGADCLSSFHILCTIEAVAALPVCMIAYQEKNQCQHVVQFYADENHLVQSIADYIATGLLADEAGIVIATASHLTGVRRRLEDMLGDAAEELLQKKPRCCFLDAGQVLPSILADGWPDEHRFNDIIGKLLATLHADTGRRVRAFGEMVTLLCEQGKHDAAMCLESMWNRLADVHAFSLLCGYPLSAFPSAEHAHAFHMICNLHGRVIPAEHDHEPLGGLDSAVALAKYQQQAYALQVEADMRRKTEQVVSEHERLSMKQTAALLAANEQLKQEIERRKRSEKELLHAQYILTCAQSVAHLGSWEIDADTEEINCSDEFYRICGLQPQSMKLDLEFMLSIVHPDDQQAAKDAVEATRQHGRRYDIEKRIVRPDGSIRHVLSQGNPVFDENQQLLAVIGSFLDITESKLAEQALQQSHLALRRLAAHQEKIKEDERKRIAREIHDELGSVLAGLKAYLTVAIQNADDSGQESNQLLIDAQRFTDGAIESVRRIIADLRPSVLDELGVWAAIEWYADRIAAQTGLSCQCMITRSAAAIQLDPDRSTMLFRIVQEALTNVMRHANASAVRIGIGIQHQYVIVEVEDDGKGFDGNVPVKRDSWGIQGMRERIGYFGGELSIAGTPGQGTILMLKLPMETRHAG